MTRFSCYNCGATFLEHFDSCVCCLESGTLLPVPEKERVVFDRPDREGCKGLGELRKILLEGKYVEGFEVLGRLPKKHWKMLLYGERGSGKSSFALQLVNVYEGGIFYASLEEGTQESFLRKLQTWEITNENIIVSDCQNLRELKNDLVGKDIDLVVIDSISVLGGEIPDLSGYAQIWICHSLKSGEDYKGGSELGHLCDIVIRCNYGIAYPEKNRFNKIGKSIRIFGGDLDVENTMPVLPK